MSSGEAQHRLRDRAEQLGSAFPPMLVAARRIANSLIQGVHGRRRAGPGEDFWQYRPYGPGDPAQHIDWRKSARADRILIRENEWAATNTLWTWAATYPGMSFRSKLSDVTKADRALLIMLAASIMAVSAGERVGAMGAPFPPDHANRSLERITQWYTTGAPLPDDALPPAATLPRFSTCLLIGDFLSPPQVLSERISAIAQNGAAGHVLQILDPAEETLPYEGRTEFLEFGGAGKLTIGKVELLRSEYHEKLHAHRERLRELCQRLGWTFSVHHTDVPPQKILLSLYGLISGDSRTHTAAAGR